MPLNRNCRNLQYLSVAYCNRVADEGFLCLAQETVCNNLIYLDLSGCTQVSGGPLLGFRLLSLRSLGLPSKNPRAPLARVSARSWLRTVGAGSRGGGRQTRTSGGFGLQNHPRVHPLLPCARSITEQPDKKHSVGGGGGGFRAGWVPDVWFHFM